ncbi:unnamed protein product [Moneuplotes crassus]|uniref:Uncharacterized protein n=1 Tax=Euplotes crassus TaxID=5936 RepID=A0AAD2D8E4_EUPCR|nr:unnamed protein product [Moneuplotes crassus]
MVHQNSLMYNVYAIPFFPMKIYLFVKKSIKLFLVLDFPQPPKGHKHERIHRHMLWPNKIDPMPEAVREMMEAKQNSDIE